MKLSCWRSWAAAGLALLCLAAGGARPQTAAPGPSDPCPPQAVPPSAERWQQARSQARDRGLLWRIERDGRSSYLYGTLHIGRWHWMQPGPKVTDALAASEVVALELDLLDPDIQRRLALAMAADPADRLPDALAARLNAQFDAACLGRNPMRALAPEIQLVMLATLAARVDGLDPAYAMDGVLAAFARAQGKPVASLESPEMQAALLRGDPATAHASMADTLGQLEQGRVRSMLVRVARLWDEGQADELAAYAQWCQCAETEADRALLKRLLDDRNGPLAERIAARHAAGQRVFAAVGTLHLVGPTGLPAQLAARGFVVRRVEFAR
jgi:uncharacterized protein